MCHQCQQHGHIAAQCTLPQPTTIPEENPIMEDNNEVQTLHPPPQKPKNKDTTVETQISHKRSLAEIQTPPTEKENEPQPNFENFRQPISTNLKKPRASTSTENLSIMSEQLLYAKIFRRKQRDTNTELSAIYRFHGKCTRN
ncbi:hypothetical protein JTB14_037725 [Gonioctena quinquepunctata]|nr:hypothetical protein JTB14_037725 [Gonioctena quinquepunctata]